MFRLSCALLPTLIPLFLFAGFYFPDDPDLGYHLSVGFDVWINHAVPTIDSYRVLSGAPEIAYSWAADAVLAALYQTNGVAGLKCWIVYSVLILGIVLGAILAERRSITESAVLLVISSVALFQAVGPRPRLWSVILFGLLLLIVRGCTEANKYSRNIWLISLMLLIVVWTNVHVSVFAALPVIGLVGLGRLLEFRDGRAVGDTAVMLAVSVMGMFANPYGVSYFSLLKSFAPGGQAAVADKILELQGLFLLPNPKPIWFWAGVLLVIAWMYFLVRRVGDKRQEDRESESVGLLGPALVALAFLVLASMSSRHFCFFVVAALFSICRPREGAILPSASVPILGVAIAVFGLGAGVSQSLDADRWYERNITAYYPAPALNSVGRYIKDNSEQRRLNIVTPFVVGHFTTWWLKEHHLLDAAGVFLDGRTDDLGKSRFVPVYNFFKGIDSADFLSREAPDIILVPEDSPVLPILEGRNEFALAGGNSYKAFYRVVER